jgi:hypothetical protein
MKLIPMYSEYSQLYHQADSARRYHETYLRVEECGLLRCGAVWHLLEPKFQRPSDPVFRVDKSETWEHLYQ